MEFLEYREILLLIENICFKLSKIDEEILEYQNGIQTRSKFKKLEDLKQRSSKLKEEILFLKKEFIELEN